MSEVQPELSQTDLDQLASDPSALIDNPELEARLDAALSQDTPPPAEPATPVQPAVEDAPPAPSDPSQTPAPQVPSWLAQVPESERPKLIEGLPAEELKKLDSIKSLLSEAEQNAYARAQAEIQSQATQTQGQAQVTAAVNAYLAKAEEYGIKEDAEKVVLSARQMESNTIDTAINQSFNRFVTGQLKIKDIPPAVQQQLQDARSFADLLQVQLAFAANAGYQMGHQQGQGKAKTVTEAEQVASKATMKAEILAELETAGRVTISQDAAGNTVLSKVNDVPPVLSGGVPTGASAMPTEDEIARYQQMFERDPLSIPDDLQEKMERAWVASQRS